ncbi:MAG: MucBP domain-containing protein [Bacilli bacterium]|nr:MucBP domain-containing protein [Bacilli bacterium]
MFSRKFSSNIRRKKRMIILTVILLVVFLSTGYAVFTTNLSIGGTLNVSKYDHTLYGVLEKAAKKGIYAREYTGAHQDSMAGVGTEKIYHWYAPSTTAGNTLANEILDKNNVIFADHCWQMIRTTDTGGVKMVYNGEPENNQCLNTRSNHIGYDYRTTQSMSTTYYYGTSYTYDSTNNVFSLDGTVTTGTIQPGQYTCKQTTSTGTCATLYLVDTLSSGTTYYVLPLNGNSHYSQFGKLQFNQSSDSPAYVGYMYNTVYSRNATSFNTETMLSSSSLSTTYYYADSYDYNDTNANKYTLTNPYQVSSTDDYASLVGKYTFRNTSSTYSSTLIYYIAAVNGNSMYYIQLSAGNNLAYYNYSYTYGDSYTDNGNGTYTINNPTTINKSDYYSHYNAMKDKYICKDATNNTCSDVWHNRDTAMTVKSFTYIKSSEKSKFSKGFNYDAESGTYTLNSDNVTLWDYASSDSLTSLNTHHYTCFSTSTECSTISYVFYSYQGQVSYIKITGGKNVEDALNEMLSNNNVNQINSTIKTGIDAWYKKYMTSYTSKLEDTIFCNDRSINALNGWNPNGGSISSSFYLGFKNSHDDNSDLSCTNITDKFSVLNSSAQLIYPVGLLTSPETYLLNNSSIRKTGSPAGYILISPSLYAAQAYGVIINSMGGLGKATIDGGIYGVRPAISLKPGTEYVSGTGSMADPYVVDVPMGTLTINYRSETGTVLHEPLVVTLPIGASYSYKNPVIPGYQTDDEYTTGTLTLPISNLSVIYIVPPDNPPIIG